MFLVQAGKRSQRLLEEALRRRENLPMVLSILASIGDKKFEPELREFSQDRDPQVAQAARDAPRVLAAHQPSLRMESAIRRWEPPPVRRVARRARRA